MAQKTHKLRWANFLHIYQPAEQRREILDAVVAQCYRPIFQRLKHDPRIRLTLNVTGALLELFDQYHYRDLIDCLRKVGKEGRIEFTGSAKYPHLCRFLENDEIVRQIQLNNQANRYFLGAVYQPRGFFPPEMAYKPNRQHLLKLGFTWIILDEIARHWRSWRS